MGPEAERLLGGFGDHLLRRKLTGSHHGKFYVMWVRKFLAMEPSIPHATPEESMSLFLDALERTGVEDWQVEQARTAVTAWLAWRDGAARDAPVSKVERSADGSVDPAAALAGMAQTLRVRRYSYRSEQSYLDWIRRFFRYLKETGSVIEERPVPTADGVRDFISQLATRRQVGASTRNQAFAALLFFFREVLPKNLQAWLRKHHLERVRALHEQDRIVETTMIYTHVLKDLRNAPLSPLDRL